MRHADGEITNTPQKLEAKMSHFYGSMKGSRGEATRCGTKSSGISVHLRGWTSGVRVYGYHDERTGRDVFKVYQTSGSNAKKVDLLLGTLRGGEFEEAS
jgi:hypothetical protein